MMIARIVGRSEAAQMSATTGVTAVRKRAVSAKTSESVNRKKSAMAYAVIRASTWMTTKTPTTTTSAWQSAGADA
jgi:hypothetical protein